MSCKHTTIQVVLNPSSGCVVTKSVTSMNGDVLANICSQCSMLKLNENTFENPKIHRRTRYPYKFLLPVTRETETWLKTSAFGKVSSISADGITIYTGDTSMEVPTGTIWYYKTKEEVITVGKTGKEKTDRLSVQTAMVAMATMLAEMEKMERVEGMEEVEKVEEVEEMEEMERVERMEEMEKVERMENNGTVGRLEKMETTVENMEMPRIKREKMEN